MDSQSKPPDRVFAEHFESLLNPVRQPGMISGYEQIERQKVLYIPVLDEPLNVSEVEFAIKSMKRNTAPGLYGFPPGVIKMLNDDWLTVIIHLLQKVFSEDYPSTWSVTKCFTIFKKGDRMCPSNYRGISILSVLPKLYDTVLANRFKLWYHPREEQAGATAGRGCEEQILTVKLLIDIARKTKRQLYIAFIDYQKAYDKVNREKLVELLIQASCGTKFLKALWGSLQNSMGKIGEESFNATAGVRQGGSLSCPLFTFL